MSHSRLWRTEAPRGLSAESYGLRLVVQMRTEAGGAARFLVLRPGTGEIAQALVGSGHQEDMEAAMAEAERMAERCAKLSLFQARTPQ